MKGSENADRDPESLEPFPPGYPWYRSWTLQTKKSGLSDKRAASISSQVSHWSVQWIARWSSASQRATASQSRVIPTYADSQNNFLEAILGELPQDEILKEACAWYIGFLEFKIRESWVTLFRDKLRGISDSVSCDDIIPPVFELLKIIVIDLARENVALTDLVDKLYNEKLLNTTDDERSHAKQLVFIVFGWITALYPPRFDPEPNKLQIIRSASRGETASTTTSPKRGARRHRIKVFETYEQSLQLNDHLDQPFYTLLGQFGRLIPQRNRQSLITGHNTPLALAPTKPDDQWIESSLLCFRNLNKVAFISVEWVDCLSLHLEFDSRTKVLRLFRLPSLCLIMASCKKLSPLTQMFWDSDAGNNDTGEVEIEDSREFYKEVLLSYRLIFGQDGKSHRDFKGPKASGAPILEDCHDSLLDILCGQDWESSAAREIYAMIEADESSAHYSPVADFPYLGKRLVEVQRFVRGHKTTNFTSLWYDKRDHAAWWGFWPLIMIGGITLVITTILGILQLAVSILQLKYARDQLQQQTLQIVQAGR